MPDRFPKPWTVHANPESFSVMDATGFIMVWVTFRAKDVIGTNREALTRDQARRIALNIAKLPDLLETR